MRRNLLVAVATLVCLLIISSGISAQDWSQWMGTNRDGKVSGFNTEFARYKVSETPVFTFPVIYGKRILIKDAEHIISFRLQ